MAAEHITIDAIRLSTSLRPIEASPSDLRNSGGCSKERKTSLRVRTGKLKDLMNVPLEIFYEVVTWLEPLDLLHLARTSKELRALLMSKGNSRLWKAARRNKPGLPDCPPHLSEPRYAASLFDHHCFTCGSERTRRVSHSLALRFCVPCCRMNFQSSDCQSQAAFIKARQAYATEMQKHGVAVDEWLCKIKNDRNTQNKDAMAQRRRDITEKLRNMGYAEEDFPVNDAWNKILNQPRALTDRIWATALPKLKALIVEVQLKKRWEEIGPYYADLVDRAPEDIRPFMPNLHDACLLPCLAVLASAADRSVPVTSTWFAAVEQQLLSEARGYVSQAKRDLVGMLHRERQRSLNVRKDAAQSMPEYTAAQIDAELSKATSLFVCPSLWCRFDGALSAWDICTHWRTAHPKLKWNDRWPRRGYEDLRNRCRSRWVQQP
ncbi:hypothetical protein C8Q76DRAFT_314579 [Earliella scabrosa]|nr:hypothetical protein C8Q76DRAFT_314579 [Earliella scabrosa]